MKQTGKTYHYHFFAFSLTAVYLFIVITHLFFTPRFLSGYHPGHNPIVKRNTELIYNLTRTDRCTLDEAKIVKVAAKHHSAWLASYLYAQRLPDVHAGIFQFFQFLPDHHSSYLSNRILRI
jgi:hypothetical protein